jgi:hypothetical protein
MKAFKTLVVAALAISTATAAVAVSSATASSTQLCTTDPTTSCTAVTHVHEENLAGSLLEMESSIFNVNCEVLFLSSKVGALGAPQVILGNYTYTGCNNNCTLTEENGPAILLFLKTGTETAKVTLEFLIHLKCGAFIDCLLIGEGVIGTAKGKLISTETQGEVKFIGQTLREEPSFLCPDIVKLNLTTTPLSATYIGA